MTIREIFDSYCKNIDYQRRLDDSLFETADRELWKENLVHRASELRRINADNGKMLQELAEMQKRGLCREEALEMKDCAISSIVGGMADAALHYPNLLALAEYFKAANDIESYLSCLYFAGFVEGEILFRSGAQENVHTTIDERIIAERDHYAEISDPEVRCYILMSYHNLAICDVEGHDDIVTSYKYLMEMEDFWNSPAVQAVDGDNEMFKRYMNDTRRLWLQLDWLPEDKGTAACDYFCAYVKELYDTMMEETGGDMKKCLIQTLGPYLNSLVIQGKITYGQAADRFYEKYRDYMDQALNGRAQMEFVCYGLIPTVNILSNFVEKADEATKEKYFRIINDDLFRFGSSHHNEIFVDTTVNQVLADQCVKSISILGSRSEKEKALFNLVIKRQLPTYLHSEMTCKIAVLIGETAWNRLPEYFADAGFTSKEEFLNFVEQAAKLHDLGKIFITDIVNMQRRRLDEEEFHGIRRHPDLGIKVVKNDPDLQPYADIIRGHHRFHDASGGYPAAFDNSSSKYYHVIDVITLADCLDAATDQYSRNYKPSKTLRQIIGEFAEGAGTRYNKDIVGAIASDEELIEKLEYVTETERLNLMYEAYSAGREMYI